MRALLQRVSRASVRVEGFPEPRAIGPGLVVLLGVGQNDGEAEAKKLAEKLANLRIFSNAAGKFDRSILDEKGEILLVSQFTLYGEAKGGRRPDFTAAARPETARPLCERFAALLRELGLSVKTGEFGAVMQVELVNEGPVTLWLDTERL